MKKYRFFLLQFRICPCMTSSICSAALNTRPAASWVLTLPRSIALSIAIIAKFTEDHQEPHSKKTKKNRKEEEENEMGSLGKAIYTLGSLIRGSGQALDRIGSSLQGSYYISEQRMCILIPLQISFILIHMLIQSLLIVLWIFHSIVLVCRWFCHVLFWICTGVRQLKEIIGSHRKSSDF